jgi:hypothetical protein
MSFINESTNTPFVPTNLKTEGYVEPISINTNTPILAWDYTGPDVEKGYRLIVASSLANIDDNVGDMLDTGHVWQWDYHGTNPKSFAKYTGKELQPNTAYYWKVKTWSGGNVWIDGGDFESEFSNYSTFTTAKGLISAKEELKNIVFDAKNDHLFRATYDSLVSRIQSTGYSPTSLNGSYEGEFSRDSAYQLIALIENGDYSNAQKMIRWFIQEHINQNAPHFLHYITIGGDNGPGDEVDANYNFIIAYCTYLKETGDTSMENDFYSTVKNYASFYLNSTYYNNSFKLLLCPHLEQLRGGISSSAYDTGTNILAAEALNLLIPIAQKRSDSNFTNLCRTYRDNILEGIRDNLSWNVEGKNIYGEQRMIKDPNTGEPLDPWTNYIWGLELWNVCPVVCESGVTDSERINNTLDTYYKQGSFAFGKNRVLDVVVSPGSEDQTAGFGYIYGKNWASMGYMPSWEILHHLKYSNWNRINDIEDFLRNYCVTELIYENIDYAAYIEGHSWITDYFGYKNAYITDQGNGINAGSYAWAQSRLRKELTNLFRDDFKSYNEGSTPSNWNQISGIWQVYNDINISNVVRNNQSIEDSIITTHNSWSDYSIAASINAPIHNSSTGKIGVGGRYLDSSHYYALQFVGNKLGIYKDGLQELCSINKVFDTNSRYSLKIGFKGSKISGYLNNELILQTIDLNYSYGKAFLIANGDDARFGKVEVNDVLLDTVKKLDKYEAEYAVFNKNRMSIGNSNSGYSGRGYIGPLQNTNDEVTFYISAHTSGRYDTLLRYSNGNSDTRCLSLYLNGVFLRKVAFPTTNQWDRWSDFSDSFTFKEGINRIAIKKDHGDNGNVYLDYLEIKEGGGFVHK